ncbi:HAD family hydrolase [Cohnella sp.]|uniref:HAD family hydrolase n=1 Tax=Cohnella sp. TaxID=1883426 RepID=UPI00356B59B7
MNKPQLVLDVAGVIVTNFSSTFWGEVAQNTGISFNTIRSLFKEVREDLWSGRISEQDFWRWLSNHCPEIDPLSARVLLSEHLKLLLSAEFLVSWSQKCDIHLLSNHRHEWLEELLEPIKPYLQSITISSQVGCCKPNSAIYEIVKSRINNTNTIYVDDQEKNLDPARRLGWTTVLADEEGNWIGVVSELIQNQQDFK